MTTPIDITNELIAYSQSETLEEALAEWELDEIQFFGKGDEKQCLCGKASREIAHLVNRDNGNCVSISSHCRSKFNEVEQSPIQKAYQIFQSCRALKANSEASASKELIEYAIQKGVFSQADQEVYESKLGRKFSDRYNLAAKSKLNLRLLYQIILTAKEAFERMQADTTTAGPKLVEYAYQRKIVSKNERDQYLKHWEKSYEELKSKERKERMIVNQALFGASMF